LLTDGVLLSDGTLWSGGVLLTDSIRVAYAAQMNGDSTSMMTITNDTGANYLGY